MHFSKLSWYNNFTPDKWYVHNRRNYMNTFRKEEFNMKYVCSICGWIYDEEEGYPDGGIAPGTKWEDVPEDFVCPICSVGKDQFTQE